MSTEHDESAESAEALETFDPTDRILRELHRRIDPILETVAREAARVLADDTVYMTIKQYAKHSRVSERTVRNWLKAGLPARRRGSLVRIRVKDADAWDMEGSTRRSAELSAHGGSQ